MRRGFSTRLRKLDQYLHPHAPPVGRLLLLIPDLWPAADQAAYRSARSQVELAELIEERTGVRPTFGLQPISIITVPVPEELLAMREAEKAAFLEQHETRPRQPDAWER